MKGIILAGGTGSRLFPMTLVTSKQLLPVYDKPMIYYPLTTFLQAGIREILLISTPEDLPKFERLLGDGTGLGLSMAYAVQEHPEGLAQAFLIAEEFLRGEACAMILGDNLFYGEGIRKAFRSATEKTTGATIFACEVEHPERFGVLEFDESGRVVAIEEKPPCPRSRYAVTGLYVYDGRAAEYARGLRPSARGELEITDLNNRYLQEGTLSVIRLPQGTIWKDMGNVEALRNAAEFVRGEQERTGRLIGAPEAEAYRQGFLSGEALSEYAKRYAGTAYGARLLG